MLRMHLGLVTVSLLALTGAVCVLRPDEWDLFTALFASVAIGQWTFLIAALTSTTARWRGCRTYGTSVTRSRRTRAIDPLIRYMEPLNVSQPASAGISPETYPLDRPLPH